MARSAESVARWRSKAAERRRQEQAAAASRKRAAREVGQAAAQRRDHIAARLASIEKQAVTRFRSRRDELGGGHDDGETDP